MGPRLDVPCPRCGAATPAGLPRNVVLLATTGRPYSPAGLGGDPPSHLESRCPSGHEVHVYYERRYPDDAPPDGSA